MTQDALVAELRQQLDHIHGVVDGGNDSKDIAGHVSDEDLLKCYNFCSECRMPAIPPDDLGLVMERSKTAEEFLEEMAVAGHKRHRPGCSELPPHPPECPQCKTKENPR